MYSKKKEINVSASVSPVTKCLTISKVGQLTIAWPHRNAFYTIAIATDGSSQSSETRKEANLDSDYITQLKCLDFNSYMVIVVTSHVGIKFYGETSDLILGYSFASNEVQSNGEMFGTGIASLDSSKIAVSTSDGSILMFDVDKQLNISFSKCHNQISSSRSITDLVSDSKCQLVSSHECGSVNIWHFHNDEQRLEQYVSFASPEQVSCTCLALDNNYLYAGYGSGHLRIFDISKKALVCEISAHAKWITAVDVAPHTGLVLTTSEDSLVRIWKIEQDSKNDLQVSHIFSESVANHMLFGGVFADKNGNSFCVGGYDSSVLHYFSCQSVE